MDESLTAAKVKKIFLQLRTNLQGVQDFHREKQALYDGDYAAAVLSVVENPKIRRIIKERLAWGRIGVDLMLAATTFDAFDNDFLGVTKLLVDCNGDAALESLRRNATIGACSFAAIIPREDGLPIIVPYTGAEATGVHEVRGNELQYGIAPKAVNGGRVSEYFFFAKGSILILDSEGNIIDGVEVPGGVMPFVKYSYGMDLASKPFGRSMLSQAFKSELETSLNALALIGQAGIANVLKQDTMIVNGVEEDFSSTSIKGTIDSIRVLFNKNVNNQGSVEIKHPSPINTDGIETKFALSASQAAVALGVHPSALAVGETGDTPAVFTQNRDAARDSFATSTLELAKKLYKVALGNNVVDFGVLEVVYREPFDIQNIGMIGDALQKLQTSNFEIDDAFVKRKLGIPLRGEVLKQRYPDFAVARNVGKNFQVLRSLIGEEVSAGVSPTAVVVAGEVS